jgi:hypothetical protein
MNMKIFADFCMYPYLTLRKLVGFKEGVLYLVKRDEKNATMNYTEINKSFIKAFNKRLCFDMPFLQENMRNYSEKHGAEITSTELLK